MSGEERAREVGQEVLLCLRMACMGRWVGDVAWCVSMRWLGGPQGCASSRWLSRRKVGGSER